MKIVTTFCFALFIVTLTVEAQTSAEELAKKLANPISSLISLPFQNNSDYGIGPRKGSRNTMNVQPVVPMSLSKDLNLIARWVQPIVSQFNITGEGQSQTGLADAVVSGFISPKEAKNGFTWGAGPVLLLPVATSNAFASKQFGIGPTAVALKQAKGWTYGALVNQIWGIAGGEGRPKVNQFFLQPFTAYNWKSGAGIGGSMELTQNWKSSTFSGIFVPTVSGVTKLGKQTVSLAAGPRIPIAGPSSSRPNFGWRAAVTLVFPK
jgi:hypothetical protein